MYLKVHKADKDVLVAVCDCCLMDKKFTEGPLQIEICSDFFGLEKATHDEVKRALSKATLANFVGTCAVDWAIELGYVDRENVLVIGGVPTAQSIVM
jgi:uncharacterized protein